MTLWVFMFTSSHVFISTKHSSILLKTNIRTWWEHVAQKMINRHTNKKNLIINNAIFHLWVMVETNRQKASKTSISFLALFLTTSLGHLPVSIQLFSSYFNIKRKLFNSPRVFIIRYPARKTRYGHIIENFWFEIYSDYNTINDFNIMILYIHRHS